MKVETQIPIRVVLMDAFRSFVLSVQDYSLLAWRSLTNVFTGPHYFQDTLDADGRDWRGFAADRAR